MNKKLDKLLELDKTNALSILHFIAKNPNCDYLDISKKMKISIPTVFRKIKTLKENALIQDHPLNHKSKKQRFEYTADFELILKKK